MNWSAQTLLATGRETAILLDLAAANDLSCCGGKAAGLADAIRLGLRVPEGYVVTDRALDLFLQQQDLGKRIESLLAALSGSDLQTLHETAMAVRGWVTDTGLPDDLRREFAELLEGPMHGKTMIVRSSAVGEDSTETSFAGQLDSFLDVDTMESLESAVKQCWASRWNERALAYQFSTGAKLTGMGVVIQRQIDSKFAGVLFTESPLASPGSDAACMLGEFCHGQGLALVSGQINPGRFRISRQNFEWELQAVPEQPGIPRGSNIPGDRVIASLADAALKLEALHGRPQDIEWAVDADDRLYVVQSRPIVKQAAAADRTPKITWTNANVRENFPEPICPVLYSIAAAGYSHYFRNLAHAFGISRRRIEAMEGPLRDIIGVHGARMYYNLSSIHSVIRMAPFGNWLIEYFNSFVGATEMPPAREHDHRFDDRNRAVQILEAVRIVCKTAWKFLLIGRGIDRFESRVERFASATDPALLQEFDLIRLRDALRAFIDIRLNRWTEASLGDASAMLSYGILNSLLQSTFGDESTVIANNLLKGVTGLVSSEPVFELWKLSRMILDDEGLRQTFTALDSEAVVAAIRSPDAGSATARFVLAFDEYLENWGFRSSGELMLTQPSFQERPAGLVDILRTYLEIADESPLDVLRRQQASRERQTRGVISRISRDPKLNPLARRGKKILTRLVLKWTQHSIGMRERARLKQALLYTRLRRILLCLGERFAAASHLARAEDIFFLTCQEIDELASSRAMFPGLYVELVNLRRREFERLGALELPDSFEMPEGSYHYPAAGVSDGNTAECAADGDYLCGVTACGGKIRGRATVLKEVAEAAKLAAGDILITTQTDPGWAHVFFLIKGLIIERGGMLSHGAILAREFGIPAVVGVPDATTRIAQHATILLDADAGRIYVD